MKVQARGLVDPLFLHFLASFLILPLGGARQGTPGLQVALSLVVGWYLVK